MRAWPAILLAVLVAGTLCVLISLYGTRGFPALISNDWAIGLPAGYQIVRTSSDVVVVARGNAVVVEATVDAYRSYTRVLAGHAHKCSHSSVQGWSVPGYFIVEYKSGKVQQGLSRAQWLAKLRGYGIRTAPQLEPI